MPDSVAPLHVQLVDAMRALAGAHPGIRPAHAKGIVCSGTFHAAPDARRMSKAPHFEGLSPPSSGSPTRMAIRTCPTASLACGPCR